MPPTSRPVHFYHLWRGGNWHHIAQRHDEALRDSGFPGEVQVVEVDNGFEDVTLRALRERVAALPGDTPVLYAHNKGAFHPSAENSLWRLYMTDYLIGGWRQRVEELRDHDVSAWCWLRKGTIDPHGNALVASMAAGNFWWARADYLKGLPDLPVLDGESRFLAEAWLAQDDPYPAYFSDAWPIMKAFTMERQISGGMLQARRRFVPNPDLARC